MKVHLTSSGGNHLVDTGSLPHRKGAGVQLVLLPAACGVLALLLGAVLLLQIKLQDGLHACFLVNNNRSHVQLVLTERLLFYASTGEESRYRDYLSEVDVLLSDRAARVELAKNPFDREVVVSSYLRAHNTPENINALIGLRKLFWFTGFPQKVLAKVSVDDNFLAQIAEIAEEMRRLHQSPRPNVLQMQAQIHRLNGITGALEDGVRTTSIQIVGIAEFLTHILDVLQIVLGSALVFLTVLGFIRQNRLIRQRSQALAISRQRAAMIAQTTNDAVWEYQISTGKIWFSEHFFEHFARPSGALNGESFYEIVHPNDRPLVHESFHEALEAGETEWSYEVRLLRSQGGYAIVLASACIQYDASGKAVRVMGGLRDVTSRRVAEHKYRVLFESNMAGVFSVDAEGGIAECNAALCRIFGYENREEFLRDAGDPSHSARPQLRELVRDAMEGGKSVNRELTMRNNKGQILTLMVCLSSLPCEDDEAPVFEGTMLDVTKLRRLQEELVQSQKMEAIGRMAGGVAHDFNNLLTVISSYSELTLRSQDPTRFQYYAEQILAASRRGSDLTNQLLTLSRKQVLRPQNVDVNAVVLHLSELLPRLIGEDIELKTELEENLRKVRIDPTYLQQVVMNLAVNARDAMPQGGRLRIATANVHLNTVSEGNVLLGDFVELTIADTGMGIDPALQEKVFEPFFTTKERGKGTGLGLSTVYGIVRQSNGHITLESELGHGATFRLYFPSLEEAVLEDGVDVKIVEAPCGTATVLVVEDESSVREAVAEFLRLQGYTILTAESGEEALAVLNSHPEEIDLLLTDVIMPGIDGQELTRRVLQQRPNTHVLFMSGYTDNVFLHTQREELGWHFLQKPFNLAELAGKINEIMCVEVPGLKAAL